MQIEIKCSHEQMVDVNALRLNERNPNSHSKDQIKVLAKIIKEFGFRHPIIVSTLSDKIVAGHGRLEAAKSLGMTEVPVDFQDFKDDGEELAVLINDNAIAEWAELDLGQINLMLPEIGPIDIELLGLKDFEVEVLDKPIKDTSAELDLDGFDNFQHQCPKCGFEWNDNGSDNS